MFGVSNKMLVLIATLIIVFVVRFVLMGKGLFESFHSSSTVGPQRQFGTIVTPPVERITDFGHDRHGFTRYSTTEGFVPWNSQHVGKYQVSLVRSDQLTLEKVFKSMESNDRGKIDLNNVTTFRDQPAGREQAQTFIRAILAQLNRLTDRRFHILDVQTINKQSALDVGDNEIVDRYTAELFIQEKDSRKVHAHAMNIRIVWYVKGYVMQIAKIHFITDYFYKRPLVDGYNPFQSSEIESNYNSILESFSGEYFRIKNPFHLQQPFFTSEDKILAPDGKGEEILENHHKDLRTPQYRCFQQNPDVSPDLGSGLGAPKAECDLTGGYWDKPVVRDEECPFFMANKNYPNRAGGVDPNGNRCEMPIGTKRIGYRFISSDPVHKPWCYNCKISANGQPGGIGPCCDEQKNRDLYGNLVSPDYAFSGDAVQRGQFWKELGDRGLNWRKHPTRIKDVTNPHQKQPIFNAIIGPGPGKIDLP